MKKSVTTFWQQTFYYFTIRDGNRVLLLPRAMVHTFFPGLLNSFQKTVLQSVSRLSVSPQEGLHCLDFGFVKINFYR